jgi:hypothetical protein
MSNLVVAVVDDDGGGKSQQQQQLQQNTVTASGCLSNCDVGPNVKVELDDGSSFILNGMVDTQTCADMLEGAMQSYSSSTSDNTRTSSTLMIPKVLIAASKVMDQSQQLTDSKERIRYLTSIVDKLEGPTSAYHLSAANAHAYTLRAQQHSERQDHEAAILDARRVVEGPLSQVATLNSKYLAYRIWADAERTLAEESASTSKRSSSSSIKTDFSRVVSILQQWRKEQPMYQTKLQREIQDLIAEGA